MLSKKGLVLGASAIALSLTACGGGGGGSHVNSTPPPPASPTPSPTPTPTPSASIPPPHLGLVSSQPFAALGVGVTYPPDSSIPAAQNVQFSYDAATNSYQINLPGFQVGTLANTGYSGGAGQVATSSTSQVTAGTSNILQPVFVTLPLAGSWVSPYTYTSFGWWSGQPGSGLSSQGIFAYGIPTASGDVPVTGSASYNAKIWGNVTNGGNNVPYDLALGGSVNLLFNFAGGTLTGSMHPEIVDGFNGVFVDFGQYNFTQTVYSTGSTSFSGKFIVPSLPGAESFFNGNFTGPNAAELIARFQAPYSLSGQQGTLWGVWIGKKN